MSRVHNKYADALVTLALKIYVLDETVYVKIVNRTFRATVTDLISIDSFDERHRQVPLFEV